MRSLHIRLREAAGSVSARSMLFAVSSTARWMGALCYLSILILIPACTKWRQDEFVRFHLNQGLMVLMLATICAALGFVPVLEQVALSLTLLVDVLSLVGLITALRRRCGQNPGGSA